MFHYRHHVLILRTPGGEIEARYSRIHVDEPDGAEETFAYYRRQAHAAFPDHRLLAIVDDAAHQHPEVITDIGALPRDDTAHMP